MPKMPRSSSFRSAFRLLRTGGPAARATTLAATLTLALATALFAIGYNETSLAQTAQPQTPPRPADQTPARELFSQVKAPSEGRPQVFGFYSNGCMAGAMALPETGPENLVKDQPPLWQAMRLSRNRYYGHPVLIDFVQDFAARVPKVSDWSGILVGDLSQPRGGPMPSSHASHQVGLDVDIWLTPSPKKIYTAAEREKVSATMLVRRDRRDIDPETWLPDHWKVIRAAAQDSRVERIFVNAAIKKALCRDTRGNRDWLSKVRPYWGHDYHMHVRLVCPSGSPQCKPQKPAPKGDGCGQELDWWFTDEVLNPPPAPEPPKPRAPLMLDDMPAACTAVLKAP